MLLSKKAFTEVLFLFRTRLIHVQKTDPLRSSKMSYKDQVPDARFSDEALWGNFAFSSIFYWPHKWPTNLLHSFSDKPQPLHEPLETPLT